MSNKLQQNPRKLRGWGVYEGDEFSFRPYEEGQPLQVNVKTCRGGKTFETTSQQKPLRVAHLTCAADAADPFAEYLDQLARLGFKPATAVKLPARQRIVNDGGLQVFLDEKEGRISYCGELDLRKSTNWQSELIRQLQVAMRLLPPNQKLNKVINQIRKEKSLCLK